MSIWTAPPATLGGGEDFSTITITSSSYPLSASQPYQTGMLGGGLTSSSSGIGGYGFQRPLATSYSGGDLYSSPLQWDRLAPPPPGKPLPYHPSLASLFTDMHLSAFQVSSAATQHSLLKMAPPPTAYPRSASMLLLPPLDPLGTTRPRRSSSIVFQEEGSGLSYGDPTGEAIRFRPLMNSRYQNRCLQPVNYLRCGTDEVRSEDQLSFLPYADRRRLHLGLSAPAAPPSFSFLQPTTQKKDVLCPRYNLPQTCALQVLPPIELL